MLIRRLWISDVLSRKNCNLDTKKEPQPTPIRASTEALSV